MDNFLRQQEPGIQRPGGFFIRLQIFHGILHWLAGLVRLTEKEQENAGIYLGDQYSR